MKNVTRNTLAVLIIGLLGWLFSFKYINEFPSHTHAWAQSDRYALSLGFVENGLNFFKPQTFLYNKAYPHKFNFPFTNTVTSVDFPIHDYIPAVFMKIMDNNSVWIFRLYILLYSCVGLFFLFKLSYLKTNNTIKSLFVVVFAATSPVFVFYQGGFLPSIPSLANAIIGIYFYFKSQEENEKINFNRSLVFLCLATLSRATFVIALVAVFCMVGIRIIKGATQIKEKFVPITIAVLTIGSYRFYNHYLRTKYGSIFLNDVLPANSFEEAKELVKVIVENWATQYFSFFHYILMLTLFVFAGYYFLKNKAENLHRNKHFTTFILFLVLGCSAFAIVMLQQFKAHDYYFLDTFYLPIILLLISAISQIPHIALKYKNVIGAVALLLCAFPLVVNAIHSQSNRRETGTWDRTTITIDNFKGAASFLDSLNIPNEAKILVIDAYAPNIPFILMKRKGYVVLTTSKENIQQALNWSYDFIVIQNDFFVSDIYSNYPEIINRIDKIADNGNISVCKLTERINESQDLISFLGLRNRTPVFQSKATYDTILEPQWSNTKATTKVFFSAPNAGYLTQDMTYGLTYKTNNLKIISERESILHFSSYFNVDTLHECNIVVFINIEGQNVYYKTNNLKDLLKTNNNWEKVDLLYTLPKVDSNNTEFGIYIWNSGKSSLYVDDFEFKLY